MKIRSITYFCNPGWPLSQIALERAGAFIRPARQTFEEAGYEVQTARLATVPFSRLVPADKLSEVPTLACTLEELCKGFGYDYLSLGPALTDIPQSYPIIPDILAATQNVFTAGCLTTSQGEISLPAVRACAEIIYRVGSLSPEGFANLRFAALANVPPGSPFFPASYHTYGSDNNQPPSFSLATEAADLAVAAFTRAVSLADARQRLINKIEANARKLTTVALRLEEEWGIDFGGIDFSLAPFPEADRSIGTALEVLGVPMLGKHGSLAAAAILAEALDRADFPHAGFCGLMLPLLEDAVLAERASQKYLTIKDLLLYSTVCGTGLDTLPLPGNASLEQISALLLDLAVLAQRLDKPLTARLMPIPGKSANDPTEFDFPYFANSRVLPLDAVPLTGLLAGEETFSLLPRNKDQ
jgi:uncharacterized protein (UPF0210 family)